MQAGISEMLGESRKLSESRAPSKLHPSSWSLPTLTMMRAPLIEPDQLHANLRLSIEHFISLQHHSSHKWLESPLTNALQLSLENCTRQFYNVLMSYVCI